MQKIYLVTKLFNVNDRLASLNLCDTIDGWIDEGILTGIDHCFLPYRDSNDEIPEDVENVSLAIFEKDLETMQAAIGASGFFDGPTYDSGIGFELGYTYSLGKPVIPITTDYFTRTIDVDPETHAISKYVEFIGDVIHVPGPSEGVEGYLEQLRDIQKQVFEQLQAKLVEKIDPEKVPVPLQPEENVYDYYFDPNFKYNESGRRMLDKLIAVCQDKGKTYVVGDNQVDIKTDIENLKRSHTVITFAEEFESDVDSAVIQGISYGLGKEIYMYSSKLGRYVQNSKLMLNKNPMTENSANAVITTEAALLALVGRDCCDEN